MHRGFICFGALQYVRKMKHLHKITINTLGKKARNYNYQFGKTKDISIQISSSGISIELCLTKIYDKSEILIDGTYLFSDAIKKAFLLYLIAYDKPLTVKNITVQIDDETESLNINEEATPRIYSLISSSLESPVNKKFLNDSCAKEILRQTKSSYDSRTAALFALLCAKSKRYETERFMYLWMSFNGLYGYYSSIVGREHGGIKISKECKQIRYFQSLFSLGNETISDDTDKTRIANEVMAIIKQTPTKITKNFLESEDGKVVLENIAKVLSKKDGSPYNMSPYGYLLTQLPYYLRCNIFHGSKPIKLFCLEDDLELLCLHTVNTLLEDFLDEQLCKWFDSDYICKTIIPTTQNVIII